MRVIPRASNFITDAMSAVRSISTELGRRSTLNRHVVNRIWSVTRVQGFHNF
jgi:hypothetical protein